MMLVQGHKCKNPGYRLFTTYLIHFLDKNIDTDLHTGIPDGLDAAYQLDNGPSGNGVCKIDAVGRYGYAPQPGKPGCSNESHFVHHRQRRTTEKCVVMIGIIRKNSFKNACFRGGDFFF